MSTSLDEVYEEVVRTAKTDPAVLGFILCGSRGKGFATAQSDYDCAMVVTDDPYEDKVDRMSMLPASLDIGVHPLQSFAEHAVERSEAMGSI
jgi:predicted nucleotidyltransferase